MSNPGADPEPTDIRSQLIRIPILSPGISRSEEVPSKNADMKRGNTMTEKAEAVIRKIRNRQAQRRDKILDEFNCSTLDDVGPLGGDPGMAVLKDMNDLEAGHEEFVKSLAPRVDLR